MHSIAKVIGILHAKFYCNRLTIVQDIQDYTSLIFCYLLVITQIYSNDDKVKTQLLSFIYTYFRLTMFHKKTLTALSSSHKDMVDGLA